MGLEVFTKLALQFRTPKAVQRFLRDMPYNREESGETLRSAYHALKEGQAHCLEATFIAAAILEKRGYPPLVLSMESQDNLDHVIFVFKTGSGWGSVARSRDEGLHGRSPRFRSLKQLVWSYYDPYVDGKGRITAFGQTSLDLAGANWRTSPKNVWKVEQFLIDLKHTPLKSSDARYRRVLKQFHKEGPLTRARHWW